MTYNKKDDLQPRILDNSCDLWITAYGVDIMKHGKSIRFIPFPTEEEVEEINTFGMEQYLRKKVSELFHNL